MRRVQALGVVFGVAAALATAPPAGAADKDDLVNRIVAKADKSLLEVLVTKRDSNGVPRFETVRVPDIAGAKKVVSDRLGRKGVVAVEMNRLVRATAYNDPLYRYQWPMDSKHFYYPGIQSITRNDTSRPRIAVVDSGVQSNHPDLAGHVISGYNTVGSVNGSNQTDDCGHGTHVAGIIGAGLNNNRGVVGLAQRAYIRPVKALRWYSATLFEPAGCYGSGADIAEAIVWAALGSPTHAQIVNLSVEADSPLEAERQAVAYAQNRGLVVVAAAGNTPNGAATYPAAYPNVLGVAAVGPRNTPPYWVRASFSNYGPWVDVAAPGVNVLSTVPASNRDCPSGQQFDTGYCFLSGTSMAAPYTSATLALAIQHCRWNGRTALNWIQRTAGNYPADSNYTGYGVINPRKLLRCGS